MKIPDNLLYTNEHEWVQVVDNTAIIGITDFAQSELGDIVFVELPNIGDEYQKNDVFGTIEAVKTVADLYSPISGKIISINDTIDDEPENINTSPYNKGWLIKITISDKNDLRDLLNSDAYKKLIK